MASQPKNPKTSDGIEDTGLDNEILESIDAVQEAIDSLNKKASVEILKVEQKYNKLRKPHYEKRAKLLSQIPNFWVTVFMNHVQLRKLINETDEKVLTHLHAVEVQEFEDITSGYKINFFFEENEWFKNGSLIKEYRIGEKGDPSAVSTKIEWYPNRDLTVKSPPKDNGEKPLKRDYPQQSSFFCWFSDESDAVGDIIGESIKDEIWPNPLQFYLNPDLDSEVEDDDEEDEEDEDEEGEGDLAYDELQEQDDAVESS